MQRVSALWQASPRKLVSALFILSMAAMMAVASGASFSSTSANAGNVVTAGNLSHTNSTSGAILTVSKLYPGQSSTGTTDITNTGNVPGVFTLTESNLVDTPSTNPFSAVLDLSINDLGNPASPALPSAGNRVYRGKLGSMGPRSLGTFAATASHRYLFTVTFPDGGKPADATSGDNVFQNASTTVDFNWEAVTP